MFKKKRAHIASGILEFTNHIKWWKMESVNELKEKIFPPEQQQCEPLRVVHNPVTFSVKLAHNVASVSLLISNRSCVSDRTVLPEMLRV